MKNVLECARIAPSVGNNHRTKNSRVWKKLLKCCHTENVTDIVFFIVCEKYIFLVLSKALDSKGILNTLKKGITLAMECADLAAFTFAMPDK